MIINGKALLELSPILDMEKFKRRAHGVTYGLSEAGYDIRIAQEIHFTRDLFLRECVERTELSYIGERMLSSITRQKGRFIIASSMEEFQMPDNLIGIVHDKSTWARRGLSVFNTVIEPGWDGFLTLELTYHGSTDMVIPAGSGIAQVIFHQSVMPATYSGRYQNQANAPVEAIVAEDV